jgi:hypothetical protein
MDENISNLKIVWFKPSSFRHYDGNTNPLGDPLRFHGRSIAASHLSPLPHTAAKAKGSPRHCCRPI